MNEQFEMVKAFHKKYNHFVAKAPKKLNEEDIDIRYDYMTEELEEFFEATNLVDQADAMIDLIYFALGTLVMLGLKPDDLFECVHSANMTKKPNKDKKKKVEKSIDFVDPKEKIKEIIDRIKSGS